MSSLIWMTSEKQPVLTIRDLCTGTAWRSGRGGTGTSITFTNVQAAQTGAYAVQVTNWHGGVISSNATLSLLPPTAPAILTQPQDQSVFIAGSASFSVIVTGSPPFSFEWRKDNAP